MILQVASLFEKPALAVSELFGLAILAGTLAASVALVYRWYAHERVRRGLPVLVGLSAVAVYRGTTTALGQTMAGAGGGADPLAPAVALFNIVAFGVAGATATAGVGVGDRLGEALYTTTGFRKFEGDVSQVVKTVGRVIAVELPAEIDDTVGYDPVATETKAQLAGRTFLFPRRLTVAELEERLTSRLKEEYGVGHVDVDLAADGSVEYIALGSRAAGIGPTLPPETAVVVVHADPAFAASAGDVVQVWESDPPARVTTAELRGVAGDVVTLAVDAADADRFDSDTHYRLVTLAVEPSAGSEFASLLRAAEETMSVVDVAAESPLVGQPVGALAVAVAAVRLADGGVVALPDRTRTLHPGDGIYAVAKPEALRKLEAAASPPQDLSPDRAGVDRPTAGDG